MGMNQSGSQRRCNIWSAQYAAADRAADDIGSSIWRKGFNALSLFIELLLKVCFFAQGMDSYILTQIFALIFVFILTCTSVFIVCVCVLFFGLILCYSFSHYFFIRKPILRPLKLNLPCLQFINILLPHKLLLTSSHTSHTFEQTARCLAQHNLLSGPLKTTSPSSLVFAHFSARI